MRNGDRFISSFFSFEKIHKQRIEHSKSGLYLSGSFFWAKDMILIDNCNRSSIKKVIEELIDEGNFINAFRRIGNFHSNNIDHD
ncbi:MAG: hypothetical protein DWQ02_22485 [Bacteroidetes bacterium]|nr:MAG: hypothetical protein DWQ02_22485 [Bacteroidota bacterium]